MGLIQPSKYNQKFFYLIDYPSPSARSQIYISSEYRNGVSAKTAMFRFFSFGGLFILGEGKMKLEKNVSDFMKKCSTVVGKSAEENFGINVSDVCEDEEINSPIEQILYCAFETVRVLNIFDKADPVEYSNEETYIVGLGIYPQKKIGKYRCDFLTQYGTPCTNGKQRIFRQLIVECDSQQFHERDEKERRYEKQRDRYLLLKGYKVFHYTGSEIIKKPLQTAAEIVAYLTEIDIKHIELDYVK